MTIALLVLTFILTVGLIVAVGMYLAVKQSLARYQDIGDAETYKATCQQQAATASQQYQTLVNQSNAVATQLNDHRSKVAQYQQLLGNLKTALDLQQKVERDTQRIQQLSAVIGRFEHISQMDAYIQNQQAQINQKAAELDSFGHAIGTARTVSEIYAQVQYYQNYLTVLKQDVEAVEESRSLQEFAFYRPHYNFASLEQYEARLDRTRDEQKSMLTGKTACVCHTDWTVDGSKKEGQKMVNQQIKLMLRAFNGECDAAIAKVKYNNMVSIENRVSRAYEQINKLGETKRIHIAPEYFSLKIDELRLAHEFQQKREEEREEQRLIREQMREEEKAAREIEKALEDAEEAEEVKMRALQKAREELDEKAGKQTAKLEALVTRLENELKDAIDRKAKAIARAQLTKSGHVYILSNIGAFGEDVYKIGMSRRLEPLDRVNELGGASVPFPFDVHAMIYCEDAPALEAALHRHFANRRVNMVNLRREFFQVTLDEIRAAVAQFHGHCTFVTIPEAEQYRQTIAMKKTTVQGVQLVQSA